jgi:DNA-binding transcriptional MerR regulator
MNEETRHTIGELADAARVTPRTIRYYTAEGLLPPPDARGRYALYSEDHLRRLLLIARLKEAYLPLEEIKIYMRELTGEQVRQLLDQEEQAPDPEAPASAADYIAQLLNAWSVPQTQLKAPLRPPQKMPPSEPAGFQLRAQMMRRDADTPHPEATGAPAPQPPRLGFVDPLAVPAAAPAPPAPAGPQSASLLRRLVSQRRNPDIGRGGRPETEPQSAAAPEAEERWRRVPLAPGVELHLREQVAPTLSERVERLITLARELLSGDER